MSKPDLVSIFTELAAGGWETSLSTIPLTNIINAGFHSKNLPLAIVATEIAAEQHPMTLRGLFYQVVSAGWLPSTDNKHIKRLGRIMTTLREAGIVPFSWIVDNIRSTIKPSSWSGIGDFIETVRDCYRRDFWASLPHYVHIFCEKDAVSGTLSPVTEEFDVRLSPVRGYTSLSYAHEIAELWNGIEKPIFAYYLGDFDPSGFDLERDLREKLERYTSKFWYGPHVEHGDPFQWQAGCVRWERLAVLPEDFDAFGLLELEPKKSDTRYKSFVEQHGDRCAEVDALPATELRRRVREAIEAHVPAEEWVKLQDIERLERETFEATLGKLTA
jgi:hypothetical protein